MIRHPAREPPLPSDTARVVASDEHSAVLSSHPLVSPGRVPVRGNMADHEPIDWIGMPPIPSPPGGSGMDVLTGNPGPSMRDRLRVTSMDVPGWSVMDALAPRVGESVFCVDGEATVVRILGRTGDGSRLLELHLTFGPKAPYFAASSNVLRPSAEGEEEAAMGRGDEVGLIG